MGSIIQCSLRFAILAKGVLFLLLLNMFVGCINSDVNLSNGSEVYFNLTTKNANVKLGQEVRFDVQIHNKSMSNISIPYQDTYYGRRYYRYSVVPLAQGAIDVNERIVKVLPFSSFCRDSYVDFKRRTNKDTTLEAGDSLYLGDLEHRIVFYKPGDYVVQLLYNPMLQWEIDSLSRMQCRSDLSMELEGFSGCFPHRGDAELKEAFLGSEIFKSASRLYVDQIKSNEVIISVR